MTKDVQHMDFTLTLVSQSTILSNAHFEKVADFLKIEVTDISWLCDNKATDMRIESIINIQDVQALRSLLDTDKIDIFCTPSDNRRKRLLIADMDSTIVTSETLDELADEAGIKDQISDITERAMRGEIDFFAAIRERVGLLKGLSTDALKRTLDQTEVSKGAATLVKTMRNHNAFCALVSGGFTYFTQAIADDLEFNVHHGNNLGIQDNALTGEVIEPILDKNTKLELLNKYVTETNIVLKDSVSIGDGANDLMMLEAAGLGIGYHPKPLLEERLVNCIRHTDLTSVLYAQGYKQEEFSL